MKLVAVLATLALAPATLHAEEAIVGLGDAPHVFSIQERPYRLGHEFQLGLGALPTDAFYVGVVANGSYTYHFTDFWAWEIISLAYSQNFDTSLRGDLLRDYEVEPVQGGGERINVFGTTSLVIKPLFGKLAIFNESLVHSETFFSVGLGALELGDFVRPTGVLGMGLRFWSSEFLSLRVDIKDYLIFVDLVPNNALYLMLSVSFNFFDHVAAEQTK